MSSFQPVCAHCMPESPNRWNARCTRADQKSSNEWKHSDKTKAKQAMKKQRSSRTHSAIRKALKAGINSVAYTYIGLQLIVCACECDSQKTMGKIKERKRESEEEKRSRHQSVYAVCRHAGDRLFHLNAFRSGWFGVSVLRFHHSSVCAHVHDLYAVCVSCSHLVQHFFLLFFFFSVFFIQLRFVCVRVCPSVPSIFFGHTFLWPFQNTHKIE